MISGRPRGAGEPRTGIERAALSAVARGEATLAGVYGVAPESLATLRSLAALLASAGRDDDAGALLAGALALDDRDRWTLRALALVHLRRGEAGRALELATRAHALARTDRAQDGEAALLAARSLVALGRRADARAWLSHVALDTAAPASVARAARGLTRRIG